MAVSWVAILILIFVLVVVVKGLANPGTRPFVVALGAVVAVGTLFLFFFRATATHSVVQLRQAQAMTRAAQEHAIALARGPQMQPSPAAAAPSSPPKPSAAPPRKSDAEVATALVAAVKDAWIGKPSAAKPAKPAAKSPESTPISSEARAPSPPPAWINAGQQWQGDVYLKTLHIGPYTTPLECDREAPKAVQAAVGEYAELLSDSKSARDVQLPENVLRRFIRESGSEIRTLEIDGAPQDMHMLHILVGFDPSTQQQIRDAAERAMVARRLQGTAVALGGVLGLLALVWVGLRIVSKGEDNREPKGNS